MRPATAALSLIALLTSVGCGGSAEDDVRDAVTEFALAYLRADGAAACVRMSPEAQEEAVAGVSKALEDLGAGTGQVNDCAMAIELAAGIATGRSSPSDSAPQHLRETEASIKKLESGEGLGAIEINNDRADVASIVGFDDSAFQLTLVDGDWLVSGETND